MAKKLNVIGALDKTSEYNKLGGRGSGDLADTCYICGISPSNLKQALYSDLLELIRPMAHKIHPNSTKFIDQESLEQALKEYFNL